MHRLEVRLADDPAAAGAIPNPWSLIMRTSARNALRGKVKNVTDGAVNAEVVVDIGRGPEIVAGHHAAQRRGSWPRRRSPDVVALDCFEFPWSSSPATPPIRASARPPEIASPEPLSPWTTAP